ncbi:DUF2147 domain-containing protein [Paracoccus litorisediminis]|jgi:uncharacterized protein (DUF2147 family)|uniref:DUF2147 domain-containing protein n=1 Tax=Paracoccus litorisediminis TaxID=2006130 RepID=A0A844HMY8_9RHOB|nr:DUF2147 domain-containing protein [Paracoccus litorisediminis]MTH59727.1 DUF2147 domain-containing protein [Paracoccus litorisediminis]
MKKQMALAALLALAAPAAQADGISGIYRTQPNDNGQTGFVQFYDCGGKTCGKLVRSFDKAGKEITSPNTGRNIVANMNDDGNGKFSGGTIWDPGSNKTYKSKMQVNGAVLNVSGCVAVFCKTQKWTPVK